MCVVANYYLLSLLLYSKSNRINLFYCQAQVYPHFQFNWILCRNYFPILIINVIGTIQFIDRHAFNFYHRSFSCKEMPLKENCQKTKKIVKNQLFQFYVSFQRFHSRLHFHFHFPLYKLNRLKYTYSNTNTCLVFYSL